MRQFDRGKTHGVLECRHVVDLHTVLRRVPICFVDVAWSVVGREFASVKTKRFLCSSLNLKLVPLGIIGLGLWLRIVLSTVIRLLEPRSCIHASAITHEVFLSICSIQQ